MEYFATVVKNFAESFGYVLALYDHLCAGNYISPAVEADAKTNLENTSRLFCERLAGELNIEYDDEILRAYFISIVKEMECPRMFNGEFHTLTAVPLNALQLQRALYNASAWCNGENDYKILKGFTERQFCGDLRREPTPEAWRMAVMCQCGFDLSYNFDIGQPIANCKSTIQQASITPLSDLLMGNDKDALIARIQGVIGRGTPRTIATVIRGLREEKLLPDTKVAPICRAFELAFNIKISSSNVSAYLTGERVMQITQEDIQLMRKIIKPA